MARKEKDADALGLPPPPKAEAPSKPPAVTKIMAEGLVGFVQVVLRSLPWTREDTLSDVEQKVLVADIVAFAKVNPWFARGVAWLAAQTQMSALPLDAGAMVAKRLARRELVPVELGIVSDLAIAVSAQAHDIPVDPDLDALTSLFGGLGGEAAPEPEAPSPIEELVSTDLDQ